MNAITWSRQHIRRHVWKAVDGPRATLIPSLIAFFLKGATAGTVGGGTEQPPASNNPPLLLNVVEHSEWTKEVVIPSNDFIYFAPFILSVNCKLFFFFKK